MVATRTERWAKPEIKHGHQNPIIKYNQEEWKFYKHQTRTLKLGIIKIWEKRGNLVVLNINSENSKLTQVVNTFSVFHGAQSLKLRLTTETLESRFKKKEFSGRTQWWILSTPAKKKSCNNYYPVADNLQCSKTIKGQVKSKCIENS